MPYIDQAIRETYQTALANLPIPDNSGELNYAITRIVLNFLGEQPRYADFNNAVGALECAKLELYRRMVAPYEDIKIAENGDVYPAR
jgi:hypothetical protein